MSSRKTEDLATAMARFVADGNVYVGPEPARLTAILSWKGKGMVLRLGEDVRLNGVKLQLLGDGAVIDIGDGAYVKGTIRADDGSSVVVGRRTRINRPSILRASEGGRIDIGQKCLFANVLIRNSDLHAVIDLGSGERVNRSADITIEDRVWLAEEAYVYKGVTIGTGSVVAARSTVVRSLPSHCVAAGTPAQVVREGVTWFRSLNPATWRP